MAATKTLKEFEKELKSKKSKKKGLKKPSKDALKQRRASIRSEITSLQGEISRTAWEISDLTNQINAAWDLMRGDKDYESARDNWTQAKSQFDEVRTALNDVYSGREFRDPAKLKADIEQQIREAEYMVNFGSISRTEENQKNRDIYKLRGELEDIEKYINSNVSVQFQELKDRRAGKNEHYEEFERLRKGRDNHKAGIDEMKSSRKSKQDAKEELNKDLSKLINQRNNLEPEFSSKLATWNALTKDISSLESEITYSKNQAEMNQKAKAEDAKVAKKKQREDEEKSSVQQERDERQKVVDQQRDERMVKIAARRAAAVAAHQKAQREKTSGGRPGQWGNTSVKKAAAVQNETVEEVTIEWFAEEKGVCAQLIALCEDLKPAENQSGGKKKKRRRRKKKITFTAYQFGLFGRVGVNPPKLQSSLTETIDSLNAKIVEYDNTPEEVEEAQAPVTQAPVPETEEEPQVCATAESTEL